MEETYLNLNTIFIKHFMDSQLKALHNQLQLKAQRRCKPNQAGKFGSMVARQL
jgi:hypothetical protein